MDRRHERVGLAADDDRDRQTDDAVLLKVALPTLSEQRPDTSDEFVHAKWNLRTGARDRAPAIAEPDEHPAGVSETLHDAEDARVDKIIEARAWWAETRILVRDSSHMGTSPKP